MQPIQFLAEALKFGVCERERERERERESERARERERESEKERERKEERERESDRQTRIAGCGVFYWHFYWNRSSGTSVAVEKNRCTSGSWKQIHPKHISDKLATLHLKTLMFFSL